LDALYQEYADDDFVVIDVLIENSMGLPPTPNEAAAWKDSLSLTYPVLADTEGDFLPTYGEAKNPFVFYLIDRDGRIVWRRTRESADTLKRIREQLEALLVQ
jgi:peroxiredoxin